MDKIRGMMKRKKLYTRHEDMSQDGKILVYMGHTGDISIGIHSYDATGVFETATAEFCEIVNGRGRSPHTREALIKLADAIEKDNLENPIKKSTRKIEKD